MVELKPSDQGDRRQDGQQVEKPALNTPEGQQVRNATGEQVEAIRAANPDAHDGSATPKDRARQTRQALIEEQSKSFELFEDDKVIAARVMEVARPAVMAKESIEQQSRTVEELTRLAKVNPVYEPILGLRQHAEGLPNGQEKDKFVQLSKEQLAEAKGPLREPENQSEDQESCGSHAYEPQQKAMTIGLHSYSSNNLLAYDNRQSGIVTDATNATVTKAEQELDKRPMYNLDVERKSESLFKAGVGYLENYKKPEITEQEVLARVAALPLQHQALILSAGIQAYQQEINHQQFRIAIGEITGVGESVVGMSQGADSLGKSICDVAQFSRDIAENNPRAQDTAAEAGHSFGKLLVGGFSVVKVADNYLGSVGAASYDGDNTKAIRDISALGQRMNERWAEMSPEEKTRLTTRLTMDNLGPMAAAGAGAKLARSMDIAGALQEFGAGAKVLGAKEREKYSNVIGEFVERLAPQPLGLTTDGRLMPIPKEQLRTDGNMLMSKADDLEGKPLDRLKPRLNTEVAKAQEAMELAQQKAIRESVKDKVENYLLSPTQKNERYKWFEKALGFTLENKEDLVRQIVFDQAKLRPARSGDFGLVYEQIGNLQGANGKILENCKFYWHQDQTTGLFRFANIMLPKKRK